jgi:chemotaxis methyl-accepting protein methylase
MKSLLRRLPGVDRFIASDLWRSYRHRISLRKDPRKNSNFTGFLRLPTQYEVLAGPVLEFLLPAGAPKKLRILSVGCSIGAEAYTVASLLSRRYPELDFTIEGFDIDADVIRKAQSGVFDAATEVFNNKRITPEFVAATFDHDGASYRVKESIKRHLVFRVADVLDAAALAPLGPADLIFAQNFLFHLEPRLATKAFNNICGLLAERAVLYVDGTDIPIREQVTRERGLAPLDSKIEEIHNEARWARAVGWPYHYWGLEPFSSAHRDWQRRYATIFLKGR